MKSRATKRASEPGARFSRQDLILQFWEEIPARPSAVRRVVDRILRRVRAMACAQGHLQSVELALREALNNAILHGSRGNPRKKVAIGGLCDKRQRLLLIVRDSGKGFDPSQIPDPTRAERLFQSHGRGIFLMRRLMDKVTFQKGGREVVLVKEPPTQSPPRGRRRAVRSGRGGAVQTAK